MIIAAVFTLILGVSKATYASTEEVSTILTEVTSISQIEVHGNVELYLSEGSTEQVKVYNKLRLTPELWGRFTATADW